MDDNLLMIIMFIILFLMLVISAIVSAIETAITGTDFVKIETLSDKGIKKASRVLELQDKQQRIISTMLFLNNVVNIVATTITTLLVTIYIKNIPLAVATAVLTFVILIFCEITPKRIANKNAENIIIFFADFIKPLIKKAAELVGVKVIYIFALPFDELIKHYEKYGFRRLNSQSEIELHKRLKPEYDQSCIFMYRPLE